MSATSASSSIGSARDGVSMGTKKRRGPRHRTGRNALAVSYREPLNEKIARRIGITVKQAENLRFVWPALIAKAIGVMREEGDTAAIAAIQARIEEACAGTTFREENAAIIAESHAENELNDAEDRYKLSKSEADRREVLRLSAREIRLQTERDELLRRQGEA